MGQTDTTETPTEGKPEAGTISAGSMEELIRKAVAQRTASDADQAESDDTDELGESTDEADAESDKGKGQGRGSKAAVLADLSAERDRRQEAETQLEEFKKQIGQLFGFTPADAPAPTTADVEAARAEARAAQTQLAVVRNAPEGVDVAALLDSNAFATATKDLDPADGTAVRQAIADFVKDHPRFTVQAPAARNSARDAAARTPEGSRTGKTMDDLIRGL